MNADCYLFYKNLKKMYEVQIVPLLLSACLPISSDAMNKTMLLTLLTKCKDVILEEQDNHENFLVNATTVTLTQTTVINSSRKSYDSAYFYILFVMFIYFFLALTLFRSFLQNEKTMKDLSEDSRSSADAIAHKYSEDSTSGKFDFEDETIIWANQTRQAVKAARKTSTYRKLALPINFH